MTSRLRLSLLLMCLFLALVLGLSALSQSRLVRRRAHDWAEVALAKALGREVRVDVVGLRPWEGSLELSRVRVAREKTLADGTLFSAERIRARWSWTALFRRQLVFRQITLDRPVLTHVAEAAPGLTVQDILSVLFSSQPVRVKGWTLRVRRATVHDGQASWTGADGTRGTLEGLEGGLTWRMAPTGAVSTAGTLRAARLQTTRGDTTRRADRISLQVVGEADAISVSTAEFSVAGAAVTARGTIADPLRAPRLDLGLSVQAPLSALLSALGSDREVEGTLGVEGRLQGPWERAVFQGQGTLQFGKERGPSHPLRFSLVWDGGRVEAATLGGPPKTGESFRGTLSLVPATGAYRVRATLANTDVARLAGLPSVVAAQLGLQLPPEARGRLTADVDLTGRGADPSTLRGRAAVQVEDLALEGETPTGRLEARLTATASGTDIEAFSLRLPGGDIDGRGSLSFVTGALNLPIRADLRNVATFARGFGLPFLAGHATLTGRVVGTRQDPRLQGRIAWREARIAGHPFDLIEGDVEVARRMLTMPRLVLRSGRTTATLRGTLEARGTTPLRRLNPKRDLVLDLQVQVNPARTADFITLLPDDLKIQGAFRANGRLSGALEALTGEVEVAFGNVRTWDESWQRGEALFRFQSGAVQIKRISLRRAAEQLTGELSVGTDGELRGRLTSTVMDLARVGSLSSSKLAGRATFRLDLQGTLGETVTLGQATASALLYRGIPLGPGTATFTVEHKAVDVDLTLRGGTHRLHLSVGPPSDRSVKGELTLADADLDLVVRVGEIEALRPWQPRGSGRILFHGPAGGLAFRDGEADFTSLRVRLGDEVWQSLGSARASWSGPAMTVRQLRLRSGGQEFELEGSLGPDGQTDLLLKGQPPLTLLKDFLPVGGLAEGLVTADVRIRGHREAPELHGTVEIQGGRFRLEAIPAEFRDVLARLDLQGDRMEIREWQAQLAEGRFLGGGEIHRNGEQWRLRLTFQEDEGRAEQLLAGLYRGKGEVTGAMSLGGTLTTEGVDAGDFWRNLDGELKLVMHDGRVGRYTVAAKILSVLSVAHLFQLKGPEFSGEGMPYQRLTADIKITRGIARTENLVLDSPAYKANAVGLVNFADSSVDVTVAVKPFQTVDLVVTKIPVAGWLLGGKEQSLIVAYFRVGGTLGDPQVTPIPVRSVGRNLFGIFRNLLEIPETLTGPYKDLPPQQIKPDEGQRH
jgi:autotransporter translocation and assembly factor TamB